MKYHLLLVGKWTKQGYVVGRVDNKLNVSVTKKTLLTSIKRVNQNYNETFYRW